MIQKEMYEHRHTCPLLQTLRDDRRTPSHLGDLSVDAVDLFCCLTALICPVTISCYSFIGPIIPYLVSALLFLSCYCIGRIYHACRAIESIIPPCTLIYLQLSNIRNMTANMRPQKGHITGPRSFPKVRI